MEKLLVIGGNAAGLSAASRAKRLKPGLEVTVLEQGDYISYSTCGVPYFIAGLVAESSQLISFTPERIKRERGIEVLTRARAVEILPAMRRVRFEYQGSDIRTLDYDKLLIATGYRARIPEWLAGAKASNLFTLIDLADGLRIKQAVDGLSGGRQRAVIVGGGYVGLEMAEAFAARGLAVTLIEKERASLAGLDPDISALVAEELRSNGIHLCQGAEARAVRVEGGRARAVGFARNADGARLEWSDAEIVLVDTGIEPNVELARAAGIALGKTGAIAVNEYMETSCSGIYAAGNCAEARHLVSGAPVLDPLGTVASKQGRVAGERSAGRRSRFLGVVGTIAVKVFGLGVASTGLTCLEAQRLGYDIAWARITAHSRNDYYPGSGPITVKVVAERQARRLLGAQLVGRGEVAKRADVVAAALTNHMRVDDASQLDLSYTPPFAPLWDPLLVALNALLRELER